MIINIGEKWRIKNDPHNFILQEKKVSDPEHHMTKKTNEIRWIDIGYYPSYHEAAKKIVVNDFKEIEAESLRGIQEQLEQLEVNLTNAIEVEVNDALNSLAKQA